MSSPSQGFDPRGLGFDPKESTAILVGGESCPFCPSLASLPEARNSLLSLAHRLSDPALSGFGRVIPITRSRVSADCGDHP